MHDTHDVRKSQELAKKEENHRITELEVSLDHILQRLHALEEKDRQRAYVARDEHEGDVRG